MAYEQGSKDRMDESRGMKKSMDRGGVFNLKDGTQAGEVKNVPTDSEQYDMGRIDPLSVGSKGYPAEAWNYQY